MKTISLSDSLLVVLAPDCVPLFVIVVQDLQDFWFVSPQFSLYSGQLLLKIPVDAFVFGRDDFKSEVDLAGKFQIEELGEFFDQSEAKLVDLEYLQLLRILQKRLEFLEFIAIFELVQHSPDLSISRSFRSFLLEVIVIIKFLTAIYHVFIQQKLSRGLSPFILLLYVVVYVLECSIRRAHEISFLLIVGDVLHPDGCGGSLSCFFGVFDCHFVLFLFVEMFVVDVGMHCSQRAVFLAAFAFEELLLLL